MENAKEIVELKVSASGDRAPCLEAAIFNGYRAFHECQSQPTREHQGEYFKRCDELGQSISRWQAQQPELVEQFRRWFETNSSSI